MSTLCRSILYVDDDPDICEVVKASLSLIAGLAVHVADSGERAIDLAYELTPDLILMDVMMPGLDGPSTLRRLRASPLICGIPVIFLTAKVLPAELAQLIELGAIGVIAKPFDPLRLGAELLELWQRKGGAARVIESREHRLPVTVDRARSLARDFLQRTRRDLTRLNEILATPGASGPIALEEIGHIAHSIHGAGTMFGFPRLGMVAGEIEGIVEKITANPAPSPSSIRAGMLQLEGSAEHLFVELQAAGMGNAASP